MTRVFARSLGRSCFAASCGRGTESRGEAGSSRASGPPSTWERNRSTYENLIAHEAGHLTAIRLTHARDTDGILDRLRLGSD